MYNKRAYVQVQVQPHSFLILPLDRGEWSGQLLAPATLIPREITPSIHCTGEWVGPRDCLDGLEIQNSLTLLGIKTIREIYKQRCINPVQ
jgi:hypothetical protein